MSAATATYFNRARWPTASARRIFRIVNGSTPRSDVPAYWGDDVTWVTPVDLGGLNGPLISESQRRLTMTGLGACGASMVPPGSIVVSTRAPIGYVAEAAVELATNQGCRALVPRDTSTSSRFYYYAFLATRPLLESFGTGSTFSELSAESLASTALPVPPLPTQRAIADFLDRKTAAIDALIEKKQKLLDLLAEKRTALINRAVTKGLDPSVPMKDSGVPWIGEIPVHWEVKRLGYAVDVSSGAYLPNTHYVSASDVTNTVPVIGGNGVMGWTIHANTVERTLVIGRVGALCGNVHIIEPPAWVTDNALCVKVQRWFDIGFLTIVLRARNLNELADKNAQPLLTGTKVRDERLPVPPIEEQHSIGLAIELEQTDIGRLVDVAGRQIDKLREYRQALITAAVTGQIDVDAA